MAGLCLLLLIFHVSSSVLALLQSPKNVQIHSANFQHILTWEDNNNNSLVYYRVQYSKLRLRKWSDVSACVNITEQHCELTDYFTDLYSEYAARVISFTHSETSIAATSTRFRPISDTDLGPPFVNISAQDCNVTISIHTPISYYKGTPSMLHDDVYPLLIYGIERRIDNKKLVVIENVTYKDVLTFTESKLPPNSNYCISVNVTASPNIHGKSIPSPLKCVITAAAQTHDSQPPYVPVIISILLLIGIVSLLIGLDRAGYICMGWNFFPKVLKSFPTSASMNGRMEYVCPAQAVSVETLFNAEMEECCDTDEEMCGRGYAARKKVLDSDQNYSGGGESSTVQPSAFSSSIEYSGQDCSCSAEEGILKEPLLDLTETCASDSELAQAATASPCPMMFNRDGVFNINLNSVSVGNSEDLWTDLTNEASPIEKQEDITAVDSPEVPPGPCDLRLITNILNLGACRGPVSELGACRGPVSEECTSEASHNSDADSEAEPEEMERPFASDYMSR